MNSQATLFENTYFKKCSLSFVKAILLPAVRFLTRALLLLERVQKEHKVEKEI